MIEKLKRKLSGLFGDDGEGRGVSPVVGIVMMVGITVVLAATIGMFVMDMGGDIGDTGPTATVTSSEDVDELDGAGDGADEDDEGGEIVFTHDGGDSMDADDLYVTVADERINVGAASDEDDLSNLDELDEVPTGLDNIEAGDTIGASSTVALEFTDAAESDDEEEVTDTDNWGENEISVESGDNVGLAYDDGSNSVNLVTHTADNYFGEADSG